MNYSVHYSVCHSPNLLVAKGNRSTCRKLGKMQVTAADERELYTLLDNLIADLEQDANGQIEVVAIVVA